jgi:hypothetical protein
MFKSAKLSATQNVCKTHQPTYCTEPFFLTRHTSPCTITYSWSFPHWNIRVTWRPPEGSTQLSLDPTTWREYIGKRRLVAKNRIAASHSMGGGGGFKCNTQLNMLAGSFQLNLMQRIYHDLRNNERQSTLPSLLSESTVQLSKTMCNN